MQPRRDWLGAVTGIFVFLCGVALLVWTFQLAYQMFSTPVEAALGVQGKEPINLETTPALAIRLVFRVVMLLLMCFIASLIANRGIKLYWHRVDHAPPAEPTPESAPKPAPADESA
jgi:flagellar biosynthesis protein FlhB